MNEQTLTFEIIIACGTLIFGSGGVVALFRARKKDNGSLPITEEAAARDAVSPGWSQLTEYYSSELDKLRGDLKSELQTVRKQVVYLSKLREIDSAHIDALEAHIWNRLPPPPPPRPQYPSSDVGGF